MDIGFTENIEQNTKDGCVLLPKLPFQIVFQNDISPIAKWIAEQNGWAYNYQLGDIRKLLDSDSLPSADVVIGGFPCQDFSQAGKRKGFDSERGTLYKAYVEVVRRVRPLVFVAENVEGLLTMPRSPITQIVKDFSEVGYHVDYQLVKCEEIGIPQRRHRVIIIGYRSDVLSIKPMLFDKCVSTCGDWLNGLDEPDKTTDYAQMAYSHCKRLRKGQGQIAIKENDVAPTIRAEHHGNIEFRRLGEKERRLTVRECAILQTFPKDCILNDERRTCSAYKPIGNAVPPLLAYRIAEHVLCVLDSL